MGIKNAKDRSSKKRQSSDIRNFESNTRIVGVTSTISPESRNDQIGVSGENSQQTNTFSSRKRSSSGITGKIVRQLIEETERQLAYYKTQATELEARLQELYELSEDLEQQEKTEKQEPE